MNYWQYLNSTSDQINNFNVRQRKKVVLFTKYKDNKTVEIKLLNKM